MLACFFFEKKSFIQFLNNSSESPQKCLRFTKTMAFYLKKQQKIFSSQNAKILKTSVRKLCLMAHIFKNLTKLSLIPSKDSTDKMETYVRKICIKFDGNDALLFLTFKIKTSLKFLVNWKFSSHLFIPFCRISFNSLLRAFFQISYQSFSISSISSVIHFKSNLLLTNQ